MVRIRFKVGRSKPKTLWSKTCPKCRKPGAVGVRAGSFFTRFWFCNEGCGWACWRPPAGIDCPTCKAAMIWAHSRMSVGCPGCGFREVFLTRKSTRNSG